MDVYRKWDFGALTTLLLSRYFPYHTVPEAVQFELARYLTHASVFTYAADFKGQGREDIENCKYHDNFVYDRRSSLVMFDFEPGQHQLTMAYLEGLYNTDVTKEIDIWSYDDKYAGVLDANCMLADDYIQKGHGIFRSSEHDGMTIMVGEKYPWNPIERNVFADYKKMVI